MNQDFFPKVSFLRGTVDVMLSGIAGGLLYAAFPPVGWWWLSIPALALFISRIDQARGVRACVNAFVFGMCMWMPLINWVPLAVGASPAWWALAFVQSLFIVFWALCVRWVSTWRWTCGPYMQALIYGVTWAGVEALRSRTPWSGFPWGSVALPQVDAPLGHLAPYGGVTLISIVVVFCGVLLRRIFASRSAGEREHWFTRPVLLFLCAVLSLGPGLISLSNEAENGYLRVGVAQGDMRLPGSVAYQTEGEVTGNNLAATHALAHNSTVPLDLVVWGEGAADRDPESSRLVSSLIEEASRSVDAPLIVGYTNVNESDRVKNWLAVWNPGEGLSHQRYSKHVPVPFGEYIPLREFISSFATETAQVSRDMEPGVEAPVMQVQARDGRSIPIAVGICFEVGYPSVIGQGVREGGQIIVTPSNNYHFQSSGESAQQGQILRMRAMEMSRSAIQASTTGSSYLIRPDGQVSARTGMQELAYMQGDLPLRTSLTWTARAGEWPAWGSVAAAGILFFAGVCHVMVAAVGRRRRARSTVQSTQKSRKM